MSNIKHEILGSLSSVREDGLQRVDEATNLLNNEISDTLESVGGGSKVEDCLLQVGTSPLWGTFMFYLENIISHFRPSVISPRGRRKLKRENRGRIKRNRRGRRRNGRKRKRRRQKRIKTKTRTRTTTILMIMRRTMMMMTMMKMITRMKRTPKRKKVMQKLKKKTATCSNVIW